MRFYSGFLLLEDVYDNLPTTMTEINTFADSIFNPTLLVVSEDCQTQLGTLEKVDYIIEGKTELATGSIISKTRINDLLSVGTYTVATRDIRSCIQIGGICQACYVASFPLEPVPNVNDRVKVQSYYTVSTDVFICNGITNVYTLSLTPFDYTQLFIYNNGVLQMGYTVVDTTLTMPSTLPINEILTVHYVATSVKPFFGYVARSYTGGLLGIKALPTESLIVRPSLVYSLISEGQINRIKSLLQSFNTIESTYYRFIDAIPDNLEKALYMIMLYGIYGNVTT